MSPSPLRPTVDARVRAAWQEQVAAAGNTPGLLPELLQRRQELLPRFAAYYTQLRALPRRVRRALQRKWKQSLAGVALMLALGQEPVLAATINVSGGCSLVNAITAANTDTATGGCPKGSGADTIRLPVGSTQTLTTVNNSTYGPTGLPVISSAITIEGKNSTIQRESSAPELPHFRGEQHGESDAEGDHGEWGSSEWRVFLSAAGGGVLNCGTLTLRTAPSRAIRPATLAAACGTAAP